MQNEVYKVGCLSYNRVIGKGHPKAPDKARDFALRSLHHTGE